ncbi:MAG: hypothetical protein WDN44_04455 [Sphingomonas sp.]
MIDDELLELARDWRAEPADPRDIARSFARHRRWAMVTLAVGVAGVALVLGCLLWLGSIAIDRRDALFYQAAFAYAAGLPVMLAGLSRLRRQFSIRYEATPMGVLQQARDRAETAKQSLVGARWCAVILSASALGSWALAADGLATARMALLLSALWGGTALLAWRWQMRRKARLAEEIGRCEVLIEEFSAAGT